MNREEFVAQAPYYYALGIALGLTSYPERHFIDVTALVGKLRRGDSSYLLIPSSPVFRAATQLLEEQNVLDIVDDSFAPTMFRSKADIKVWLTEKAPDIHPVFKKFGQGLGTDWLKLALNNLNQKAAQLKITAEDFGGQARADDGGIDEEGADEVMIPIERPSAEFRAMEQAVAQAIEKLETDNEFTIAAPAQRDVALSGLKALQKSLADEAHISWLYVKTFALAPLSEAAKKAGDGAMALVLQGAKAAITDWVKKSAGDVIKSILGG